MYIIMRNLQYSIYPIVYITTDSLSVISSQVLLLDM